MTLNIASGTTADDVAVAPSRSWLVLVAGRRPPLPKNVQLTSLPKEPMSAPQLNCPFAHASLAVWPVHASSPAPAKYAVAYRLVVVALVSKVLPVSVVDAMIAARLALSCPPTLSTELTVEEPVTANADEVADTNVAPINVDAVVPVAVM